MRPIDADAIKLPKGFFEEVDNVPKFYEWLNELPTIDAVPVVRCKDCKWKIVTMLKENYCLRYEDIVKDDYFCADGERSEDG